MHRRERLSTTANPDSRHDYLVKLHGDVRPGTRLWIRYAPDRLIVEAEGLVAYLAELASFDKPPEALALAVLDDLNNELVPRWVEVTVECELPLPHSVTVEDRQPQWDNLLFFARLPPLQRG